MWGSAAVGGVMKSKELYFDIFEGPVMHLYLFNPTDKTFTKSFGIIDTSKKLPSSHFDRQSWAWSG